MSFKIPKPRGLIITTAIVSNAQKNIDLISLKLYCRNTASNRIKPVNIPTKKIPVTHAELRFTQMAMITGNSHKRFFS